MSEGMFESAVAEELLVIPPACDLRGIVLVVLGGRRTCLYGVKPVTSRWVNTDKYGPDGQLIKHKSRLVARGFQQEEGIDYDETFASVVKPRCLVGMTAHYGKSKRDAED